jgi:hypothetical protein
MVAMKDNDSVTTTTIHPEQLSTLQLTQNFSRLTYWSTDKGFICHGKWQNQAVMFDGCLSIRHQ